MPYELHHKFVAVNPIDHCAHVTVVAADNSGHLYMYDNVTPGKRMRVNSIIDLIPYVFEYYRVHVIDIELPDGKEDCVDTRLEKKKSG